jgi:hypothetical protein
MSYNNTRNSSNSDVNNSGDGLQRSLSNHLQKLSIRPSDTSSSDISEMSSMPKKKFLKKYYHSIRTKKSLKCCHCLGRKPDVSPKQSFLSRTLSSRRDRSNSFNRSKRSPSPDNKSDKTTFKGVFDKFVGGFNGKLINTEYRNINICFVLII